MNCIDAPDPAAPMQLARDRGPTGPFTISWNCNDSNSQQRSEGVGRNLRHQLGYLS
jgi:hypothetical protein